MQCSVLWESQYVLHINIINDIIKCTILPTPKQMTMIYPDTIYLFKLVKVN